MSTDPADRPRLGAQGQVYVTLAAAQSYADAERLGMGSRRCDGRHRGDRRAQGAR
jgi:hypothetical protein